MSNQLSTMALFWSMFMVGIFIFFTFNTDEKMAWLFPDIQETNTPAISPANRNCTSNIDLQPNGITVQTSGGDIDCLWTNVIDVSALDVATLSIVFRIVNQTFFLYRKKANILLLKKENFNASTGNNIQTTVGIYQTTFALPTKVQNEWVTFNKSIETPGTLEDWNITLHFQGQKATTVLVPRVQIGSITLSYRPNIPSVLLFFMVGVSVVLFLAMIIDACLSSSITCQCPKRHKFVEMRELTT